jgi:hypothetical protein
MNSNSGEGEKNSLLNKVFPYPSERARLAKYQYYENLFLGEHFLAFAGKINSKEYNREYAKIRYVVCNFAGMLSKIVADMLFSEPPSFKVEGGDQEWVDELLRENKINIQNYESALSNSYLGDAVFRLRIGKRYAKSVNPSLIIEDITPSIFFPHFEDGNLRKEPSEMELAWEIPINEEKKYLRREIHTLGEIKHELYLLMNGKITAELNVGLLNKELTPIQKTNINKMLVIHVSNWKTGKNYFGYSDYLDLETIFYAINNRFSKISNILDKHSDPILTIPEGILDEKGEVDRKKLGVIEVREGENNKPEYIVWDANLENAFKEIDKLVEAFFMSSETSPDILGMGEGKQESGRALKLKLLRTIAKTRRKRLYYDFALKELIYTAQLFAKANNIGVGEDNLKLKGKPVYPSIEWEDGLPEIVSEQIEDESKAIDAGITNEADSMMRIYGYDEETAKAKADEIKKSNRIEPITSNFSQNPFKQNEEK